MSTDRKLTLVIGMSIGNTRGQPLDAVAKRLVKDLHGQGFEIREDNVAQVIPLNAPQRQIQRQAESTRPGFGAGLADRISRVVGRSDSQIRVDAMTRSAKQLIAWVDAAEREIDRQFVIQQLEAALKSVRGGGL